ncbi:MAG TPA: YfiR family protein [Allosphingosinicella sp.]|nr:YfiR family protein [Allosphingosinicella sp.]
MDRRGALPIRALGRIAAAAALVCAFSPAAAQPSDVAVKAAFLSKFPSYVAWPGVGGGSLNLCVIGTDPFGRLLDDAVRGQQVGGRPLQLRKVADVHGADDCQIAFVQGSAAAGTTALLNGLRNKPVLTVTDGRSGGPQGMIHFVIHDGRVRFHINNAQAAQHRLAISSRLLGLALSVKGRR